MDRNSPHLSLIFHERPHFPKICISQDLKVNIVNARFSRNFCGPYLVDKVLCGRYLVDIRFFFWWLIFDKTPVAGLNSCMKLSTFDAEVLLKHKNRVDRQRSLNLVTSFIVTSWSNKIALSERYGLSN